MMMDTSDDAVAAPETCPRCSSTRYTRPDMRILATPCGHYFCDSCKKQLFLGRPSCECPGTPKEPCRLIIHPEDLKDKIFEDGSVHKEVLVRQKELSCFNKTLDDFGGDLRLYNDYLEMVEDFAFNLANGVEVEETRQKIAEYREQNKQVIQRNNISRNEQRFLAQSELQLAADEKERRRKDLETQKAREKLRKGQEHESLILRIGTARSGKDAQKAFEEHARRRRIAVVAESTEPTGQQRTSQAVYSALPTHGETYRYKPPQRQNHGLPVPDTPAIVSNYGRAMPQDPSFAASGYAPSLAVKRALEEAFEGLFIARPRLA